MKDESSIYGEYFEYHQKYTEMHGPKTVVCMQVGSFYELYGLKYPNSDFITGSLISEISDITGLSVVSKKDIYKGATVYMSGFRDLYHTFDKYLQIMMEHGYIVVEIVQDPDSPEKPKQKKKTHSFKAVHSAGTYLSYETDIRPTLMNHMMSIWMEQNCKKKRLIYGVSVLNIYTGESAIFEHEMEDWMNPTMFDELERYVAMYNPSEVIFLHDFQENSDSNYQEKVQKILNYIKLPSNSVVHLLSIHGEKGKTPDKKRKCQEILSNCTKQKYIEYVLEKYFGEDTFQVCTEFAYYMYATQSLCYLLHFLEEHNQCFTQKLCLPTFQNTSKRVVLANHTLKQLNILAESRDGSDSKGTFGSILSLLNKCQTAMGKRKFQTQLLQPVFDEKWLNQEYEMTDFFLKGFSESDRGFEKSGQGFSESDRGFEKSGQGFTESDRGFEKSGQGFSESGDGILLENFRKGLAKIKDLEKIGRQVIAKKIYPSSIYDLYQSLSILQQLQVCMAEFPKSVLEYLSVDESQLSDLLIFLETNLRIHTCQNQISLQDNIIAKGISKEIDHCQNRLDFLHHSLLAIREYLGKYVILKKKEKEEDSCVFNTEGPIKISESDKNGFVLTTTKTRGDAMISLLSNKEEHTVTIQENKIHFTRKEIRIHHVNKTTSEIHFPSLDAITEEMGEIRSVLQEKTKYYFLQFLEQFIERKYDSLVSTIRFASTLDVILCKAYIAKKYRYCRPVIDVSVRKAYVDARDIRHALIEHINQKEIYVTNDLILSVAENEDHTNKEVTGMVLFGTNAVGKTSLIRSLGIAVIMAQAGIYVPCSSFRYRPYTSIFSRILSNDNLFKGLSTFAVEISELGVILKNADQNSLILGDELCSGTETDSALAIFMTTLEHLHRVESTFLFATHFHEILEFEEMGDLILGQSQGRIGIYHLAVTYDREKDCLIYDRKLKAGEGSRTYGLEVCKSLYLPTVFLERAYELRRKISPENDGILSHVSSKYNAKKIRGFCENCKIRLGEEIHHMREQREANMKTGYFEGEKDHWIHKNHPANLMSVCAKCHDLLHTVGNNLREATTLSIVKEEESAITSGNISPITISTNPWMELDPSCEVLLRLETDVKIKKTRIRKKTTNGYQIL